MNSPYGDYRITALALKEIDEAVNNVRQNILIHAVKEARNREKIGGTVTIKREDVEKAIKFLTLS